MPSDAKEIPLLSDAEPLRSEPAGFAPGQMVTCEVCLRSNPPTRTSCLYCAAQLPETESNAALQRPTLRRLETWEQGFNTILLPNAAAQVTEEVLHEAGGLLRLDPGELRSIVEARLPLPVARAATPEEASLIKHKLSAMGLDVFVASDDDLTPDDSAPKRARAFELTESELVARAGGGNEAWRVAWDEIALLVAGHLFNRRIEVEERKGRKPEAEIVDTREMLADEAVLDIYTLRRGFNLRVTSGNFDFSCLGARKSLMTTQNFSTLIEVLRARAGEAIYDDSYNRVRRALASVWPLEQKTEARGWRRERPGRVHTEAVTTSGNETQFTRYSRLRHYLLLHQTDLNA